jgi:hypothetical protein
MQKLDQKLPSSRLFEAHPHEKDLPEPDRSSRLFIALPRIVGEQMTSIRMKLPIKDQAKGRSALSNYWNINSVIILWDFPINGCKRLATPSGSPELLIPDNLQN